MKSRTYIMIVILVGVGVTIYLAVFMPTMVPNGGDRGEGRSGDRGIER